MKLRILRKSITELASIMNAAAHNRPYKCGEPTAGGIMSSLVVDIRDGIFNSLPERTKQQLWDLDVRINPYQASIQTPGQDHRDFPGHPGDRAPHDH